MLNPMELIEKRKAVSGLFSDANSSHNNYELNFLHASSANSRTATDQFICAASWQIHALKS